MTLLIADHNIRDSAEQHFLDFFLWDEPKNRPVKPMGYSGFLIQAPCLVPVSGQLALNINELEY